MEFTQEQLSIYRALLTATKSLAQGNTPDEVLSAACDALVASSTHICLAWMYLGNPASESITPSYAVGRASGYTDGLVLDLSEEAKKGPGRRSLENNEPVLVKIHTDLSFGIWRDNAIRYGLQEGLTLPIGDPNHPFRGLIVVFVDTSDYFEHVGIEPFIAFSELATVSLGQARLKISLEEMASIDPLTALLNRRAFQEVINREYAKSQRTTKAFSFILFDLDRFKMLNDNYGHDIGDQFLLAVSEVAKQTLRTSDWLCRWGGEEFLWLVKSEHPADGPNSCDALQTALADLTWFRGNEDTVTCSLGFTSFPLLKLSAEDWEVAIKLADDALYRAKKAGKNRWYGLEVIDQSLSYEDFTDTDKLLQNNSLKGMTKSK